MIDGVVFQALRPHLFSVAYRMLGSASDAEDIVQDAYLRAAGADTSDVRSARAWLTTVVTRLCLDRLKSAQATREQYVGPWLPEPILTDDGASAEVAVERHEWITLAFLTLLESLSPQERAVFLLREVFDYDHAEIASTLGITPANARQIFHRAKTRVGSTGLSGARPTPDAQAVVERFMSALRAGDAKAATTLLADDVTFRADGGGKVPAARVTLVGREHVGKFLEGLLRNGARVAQQFETRLHTTMVNAEPAIILWVGGRLETVFVCSVEDARVAHIYALRNPDKIARLERELREGRAGC